MTTKPVDAIRDTYGWAELYLGMKSRRQFAQAIGVTEVQMSKMWNHERPVTAKTLHKICAAFPGVFNFDNLLAGEAPIVTKEELDRADQKNRSEEEVTPAKVGMIELVSTLVKDLEDLRADTKQSAAELHAELERTRELNATLSARITTLDRIIGQLAPSSYLAAEPTPHKE